MKLRPICENHLFVKAYSKGKRAVTPALAVYILPDYAAGRLAKAHPERRVMNRYGLTVSSKVGNAVVRSRVRRILREAIRALEKEKCIRQGNLVVIAARSSAVSLKTGEITRQMDTAFEKLGLYRAKEA